jgi:sortase A
MRAAFRRKRLLKRLNAAGLSLIVWLLSGHFNLAAFSQAPEQALVNAPLNAVSPPASGEGSGVDISDWSSIRVKAYKEALEVQFPSPIAVLTVPRIHVQAPLFEGTSDLTLDRGLGRILGTARPGELGNIGVAGHRDGFFRPLKDIQVGDTIDLATASGIAVYNVKHLEIVDPDDIQVLKSSSASTLTLVTCYPFYFAGHAPKRFIVEASLTRSSVH